MSFGGDATIEPDTTRGRNWPCLRQFCVFIENQVGSLHDLMRHLEGIDVRVVALSVIDSIDFAVVRLMVDNYERGKEILDLSPFTTFETDVIGVELPDDPQPYVRICLALLEAELNIHYSYPLLYHRAGHGAIALYVDDVDLGLSVLAKVGFKTITEQDLLDEGMSF